MTTQDGRTGACPVDVTLTVSTTQAAAGALVVSGTAGGVDVGGRY